jgi:2-dehydropantoate 2-reductase
MSIERIGVIGVGGVGGYFGGRLCSLQARGGEVQVSFVARGAHLRAIQEAGLRLRSEADGEVVLKPALATDDFAKLPPLDLCLLCVKAFDLLPALSRLRSAIGEETVVLPLLNGVDVNARIRGVIRNGVVLPACVYIGTHIESPGCVVQNGGACKILFGPDPGRPDFSPSDVIALFARVGVKCEWTPSIQVEIWTKFIFICAYGLVCAAHGKSLGEILDDANLKSDVRSIMVEAAALARESGVSLPDDIVESSLLKATGFPHAARTSFQRDFERLDRDDERDLFAGAMLRLADDSGISIPRTREVAALLSRRKPARPNA